MTSAIAKKAGLKVFEKHLANYTPTDPLYEEYTDERGRKQRRKRDLPPGLSKRDAAILKKVKSRAHYLDKGFSVCGLRFGWTFIIGIIPMAGDVADASLNYFLVVRKAKQAEIPGWLLRKMLANNAVSAGVGFIPLVGDVILASYKANSRNAALLEEFLRIRGEEFLKAEAGRQEDPSVVKPGAGRETGEAIPGKSSSTMKSLFNRSKQGGSSSALAANNGNGKSK
ncbi:hypothetical protein FRC12_000310 [Ceratobasidium sp. 428]|nr:hypothetical protein FRC12_000310 [Ceratobasidium sp. 428]